jgi:hypothetical protein
MGLERAVQALIERVSALELECGDLKAENNELYEQVVRLTDARMQGDDIWAGYLLTMNRDIDGLRSITADLRIELNGLEHSMEEKADAQAKDFDKMKDHIAAAEDKGAYAVDMLDAVIYTPWWRWRDWNKLMKAQWGVK